MQSRVLVTQACGPERVDQTLKTNREWTPNGIWSKALTGSEEQPFKHVCSLRSTTKKADIVRTFNQVNYGLKADKSGFL